jgi:cytochrome bd-type quinol oxidase subunit 2
MKRLNITIAMFLAGVFMLLAAPAVYADQVCDTVAGAQATPYCKGIANNSNPLYGPAGIITKGISLLALATGLVSVIMIIIGGAMYVMSSGDSANINKAKNTILYAVVGLVVATVAQGVVLFVLIKL